MSSSQHRSCPRAGANHWIWEGVGPRAAALSALGAGLLVTVSAGCGTPFHSREQVSLTAAMPAEKLVLRNRVGDIIVHADPEADEIRAEAVKIGRASTQIGADNAVADILVALTPKQDEPGTVLASVEHPSPLSSCGYQVDWRIIAPPELAVEIRGSVSNVEVCGFEKQAVVKVNIGDVDARSLPNGLQARTSVGDVRAEAGGPIDVRSALGDLYVHLLAGKPGPVSVHSDLGDLQVRVPSDRSGRLVAHTRIGSLRLRLEGITMRTLRQRGQHFDAELAGQAEPAINLDTDLGDVIVTTYPGEQKDEQRTAD